MEPWNKHVRYLDTSVSHNTRQLFHSKYFKILNVLVGAAKTNYDRLGGLKKQAFISQF